jgi:hypothetical protein
MTDPTINTDSINPGEYPAYIKDITLFNRGDNIVVETNFLLKQVLANNATKEVAAVMRQRMLGKLGILLLATTSRAIAQAIFYDRNRIKDYLPASNLSGVKMKILGIPTVGERSDIELAQMSALNGVDMPYSQSFTFAGNNPDYLAVFAIPLSKMDATAPWQPSAVSLGVMASELVIKNGSLNTESILFFKAGPTGNTSYNAGHRHRYVISAGQGRAEEVCRDDRTLLVGDVATAQLDEPVTADSGPAIPPSGLAKCHEHAIVDGEVQIAGHSPHTHNLVASPSNGVLWIGDVHQDSERNWRTGPIAAGPGPLFVGDLLTIKKIYTSKLFDQRNLARIERLQVDFNKMSGLLTGDVLMQLRRRLKVIEEIKKGKATYISDVSYSKSQNNDLRLTFGFNYLEAIRRNGVYAPLYGQASELLNTCEVKSFRVVRRRVKEANIFNKLTGGDTPQRIYDEEPLEIIGEPTRIGTLGLNTGVFQYMITDSTMDAVTVGLYEYGVEISIIDKTKDKLVDILRNEVDGLDILIPRIEQFLTKSLMKNNYNITTNRYTKKFLREIIGQFGLYVAPGTPWTWAAMKYISALRLLYNTQLGDILALETHLIAAINPSVSGPAGIQFLLKILKNFASSLRQAIGEDHKKAPGAAQTYSTSTFGASSKLKVFQIQQFFLKPIDADELLNYGFDYLSIIPNPPSSPGLRRLTANQFNNLLDIQTQKFGSPATAGTSTQNPNVKFLTPNYLRMVDGTISNLLSTDEAEQNKASNNIYRILQANVNRNSPPSFPQPQPAPNNATSNIPSAQSAKHLIQNNIIENNSCTVAIFNQSQENPIANIFSTSQVTTAGGDDYKQLVDVNEYISSTSKFGNPSPASVILDFTSGSTVSSLMLPGFSADGANIGEAQQANSSVISEYLLQADFFTHPGPNSPLPNLPSGGKYIKNNDTTLEILKSQQKKIALYMNSSQFANSQGPSGKSGLVNNSSQGNMIVAEADIDYVNQALSPGALKPENIALTVVKYGFVHVVEYLAGYKIANGSSLLGEEVWGYVSDSIIQEAETGGASFLCRLTRHPGPMGEPRGLRAPTYNEYFILGPGQISSTTVPIPNTSAPALVWPNQTIDDISQFSDSLEFASSYDMDVTYGGMPSLILTY